jgi:enoyl-CoA hydratase/carnithine racemase
MMCCVTIAAKSARFGEPEIRFSTSPPAVIMPWIVGLKKARELLYTGDMIDAEEAHRIGMVNRVVPDEALEEQTFKLARRMAAISIEGLQTTKASINRGSEIAGIRQAIAYGVEQGAMLDSAGTETLRKFDEVRAKDGLAAAIRWRESQFVD